MRSASWSFIWHPKVSGSTFEAGASWVGRGMRRAWGAGVQRPASWPTRYLAYSTVRLSRITVHPDRARVVELLLDVFSYLPAEQSSRLVGRSRQV